MDRAAEILVNIESNVDDFIDVEYDDITKEEYQEWVDKTGFIEE